MKKYFLTISIILCLYINSHSQLIKHFSVNVMPLSFLDILQPAARFGIKVYPFEKVSVDLDFKACPKFLMYFNDYLSSYFLWQIRPQINYTLVKDKNIEIYTGFEFFYQKVNASIKDEGEFIFDSGSFRFDSADRIKTKEGYNLKIGIIIFENKHLYFDIYFGLGYYRKFNEYRNIQNGVITDFRFYEWATPPRAGFSNGLNVLGGLKLGYRL